MSTLGEIIYTLAELPADMVFREGFAEPHSYRGDYYDLAFVPTPNTRAGDMLADAQGAVGKTFTGYKGGVYKMDSLTDCWLAKYGDTGESLNIGALVTITRLQAENARLREQAEALADAATSALRGRVINNWLTGGDTVCLQCGQLPESGQHDDACWVAEMAVALAAYREAQP